MIGWAPASAAPCTTFRPTPPAPKTATDWPGSTRAVLITAPTPVITPQPTRQALSSGMSASIGMQPLSGTTVNSAIDPTPASCPTAPPSRVKTSAARDFT